MKSGQKKGFNLVGIWSGKVEIWPKKRSLQKLPQPNLTAGLKFLSGVARLGMVGHGWAAKHASVCKVLESSMFNTFF